MFVRRGAKEKGNPLRDKVVRGVRSGKKRWKEENEHVVSLEFETIRKELAFRVGIIKMSMVYGLE